MTIEERAKEYATKVVGGEYHGGFKGEVWLDRCSIYTEVATEQKRIDDREMSDALFIQRQMFVEKACEWLRNNAVICLMNEEVEDFVDDFRKAMEEAL